MAEATAPWEGDAGFARAEKRGFKNLGWVGQREPALPPLTHSKAVLNWIRILTNTSWFTLGREDQSPRRTFQLFAFPLCRNFTVAALKNPLNTIKKRNPFSEKQIA